MWAPLLLGDNIVNVPFAQNLLFDFVKGTTVVPFSAADDTALKAFLLDIVTDVYLAKRSPEEATSLISSVARAAADNDRSVLTYLASYLREA